MIVKEKEYISALLLLAFFGMTILGLSSASGPQFLHLIPFVFLISMIVIIGNNKYQNFDHYFFYFIIFVLSFLIHLMLDWFQISILQPSYSKSLGVSLLGIPLVIPVIWVIVINSVNGILRKFNLNQFVASLLGAVLIVVLDVFIEAQAVKFGFWSWVGGDVPVANFVWWFSLSLGFLFASFKLNIRNNTFIGATTYILLLLFFAASDAITF